ncbi:hypothetical protein BA895_16945 [Humibacillus sp. DSM 29435]|nr:hypothetical protein BA895_16945 [Humibacillus sp. DSM 29435]
MWFAVLVIGLVFAVVGAVALFKLREPGEHSLHIGDTLTLKSSSAGWSLTIVGLLMVVGSAYQVSRTIVTVTDVALTTGGRSGSEFQVRCPIAMPLEGSISVDGDGGVVQYRLNSQDGLDLPVTEGKVRSLTFKGSGTKTIRDQVEFSIPEGEVYRKVWLQVVSPDTTTSDPVEFRGVCDPTLPPGPTLPPPNVGPPSG